MNLNLETLKKIRCHGQDIKVLYVEDNEDTRRATYNTLKEFFSDITTAVNGLDGLEKFRQDNFELIITDINMPKMNGIEMVSQIKDIDQDISVLIISANNESSYFMETIRLGVEGYLLKPTELDQFLSVLSKTINKISLKKELDNYQKQLEQKIEEQVDEINKKNQYLQEREKFAAMGEMIDAIAHQFRQPLGIIRLQTQEIEYLIEEVTIDQKEIKEAALSIHQQINHSLDTIEEFRNFFREDIELETVNIKEVLDSILVLMKDELINYNISTLIQGDAKLNSNINPNEFKHVVLNLINNAKDMFIEKNTKKRALVFDIKSIQNAVSISIEDNAGGIPDGIIDKIFNPNFTTKGRSQGTGIGLHISTMILDKIDAKLSVKNTNKGAKFTITIPTCAKL